MSVDELNAGSAAPASAETTLTPQPLPAASDVGVMSGPALSMDQPDWDAPLPAASGVEAAGAESSLGGTASDGAPAAPAATAPTTAAQQQWSIQQAARQFGVDLSRYDDPTEALGALVSEARQAGQYRQMADYGQRYLQNAREFEEFMAQRQQQQAAQQQTAPSKPAWEVPPWDPKWLEDVTRDEKGRLIPVPGASPTVVQDIRRRQDWENQQLRSLLENPAEFIGKFVTPREQERAEIEQAVLARVQQALGSVSQSQQATNLIEQNADLLFVRNEAGQVIRDPQTGQRYQSPDGQLLTQYLQSLKGLPEELQPIVAAQWIAMRRAVLGHQNTGGPAPATAPAAPAPAPLSPQSNGHQADADFLRRAAGYTPDAGGTLAPPPPRPGTPPSQNPNSRLEDRLRHAFASNGVGDGSFEGF